MKKHVLALFASILFTIAPQLHAADLIEVMQQAVESDPTFQAARAQRLADIQNVPIAMSSLLPFVGASANTRYNHLKRSGLGSNKFNTNGYEVGLSQPLFDYEAWTLFNQAKTTVKVADATLAAAAEDLIVRTVAAYLNVLLAEDDLRFIVAEKIAVYQQLDQVTQQFKVGLVAITDVYQAQAQYDSILAEEIAAKNNTINTREELRAITGVYYKDLDGLKEKYPLLPPNPSNPEKWVEMAEEFNWSYLAAQYTAQVAKEQITVDWSGHLPTLNAVGNHTRARSNAPAPTVADTRSSFVGLELDVPVFQGFFVTSTTTQSKYDYMNAKSQAVEVLRSITASSRINYNNVVAGVSKIKADKQAIKSNDSSLSSTIEGYKVGTQTMLDVLQAQQDLFDAQRIYARDQYDYINANVALEQAAGTLTVDDIQRINSWLTESKNTYSATQLKKIKYGPLAQIHQINEDKQKQALAKVKQGRSSKDLAAMSNPNKQTAKQTKQVTQKTSKKNKQAANNKSKQNKSVVASKPKQAKNT